MSDIDFEQDKINIIGNNTKTERERDAPLSFRAKLALMKVRELYPTDEAETSWNQEKDFRGRLKCPFLA